MSVEDTRERVSITVELGEDFAVLARADHPLARELAAKVHTVLADVCRRLGIEPAPAAVIRATAGGEMLRVRINERVKRYAPPDLDSLAEVFMLAELGRKPPAPAWEAELARAIQAAASRADSQDPGAGAALDTLAAMVGRLVHDCPEQLLGPDQAAPFLDGGGASLPRERLLAVLRAALKLHVAVGDRSAITGLLADGLLQDLADADIAESLVTRLRSRPVRIEVSPDYLESLLETPLEEEEVSVHDPRLPQRVSDTFGLLIKGLFSELGLRLPDLRLVPAAHLKEGTFAVEIAGALPSLHRGLAADQLLVKDVPANLAQRGIAALDAVNPATGEACAIADADHQGSLVAAGAVTWTPFEYLVLTLSGEVRRHADLLLDAAAVELELALLHESFPHLVLAALQRVPVERLTRVLRLLLREGIRIRDLRSILESILAMDLYLAAHRRDLLSEAGHYAAVIRADLKHYITRKHARGETTLSMHLLDPELERQIDSLRRREPAGSDNPQPGSAELEEERERVRAAVRAAGDPSRSPVAVILTTTSVRAYLWTLMADERPDLAVLAYEELVPEMNIRLIGKIAPLNAAAPGTPPRPAAAGPGALRPSAG